MVARGEATAGFEHGADRAGVSFPRPSRVGRVGLDIDGDAGLLPAEAARARRSAVHPEQIYDYVARPRRRWAIASRRDPAHPYRAGASRAERRRVPAIMERAAGRDEPGGSAPAA